MLPAWRRFWSWKKSKSALFLEALAQMSDLDIAKITEDALGYSLPQFDQRFEGMKTCSNPNRCQDDDQEKSKTTSSKSNGIEQKSRHFEEKEFEQQDVTVECSGNEIVLEMSSFSPSSPCALATHGDTPQDRQIVRSCESQK
jgi:hypothetical protein